MRTRSSFLCSPIRALFLFSAVLGCANYDVGPTSPYLSAWDELPEHRIRVPDHGAVASVGARWTFDRPLAEVWSACLAVATQYDGVLASTSEEGRRGLVFARSSGVSVVRHAMWWGGPVSFEKNLDTWLSLSAISTEGGTATQVAIAWLEADGLAPAVIPEDHRIGVFERDAELAGSEEAFLRVLSPNLVLASQNAGQTKPTKRRHGLAHESATFTLYALGTQIYGPARWVARYVERSRDMRPLVFIERASVPEIQGLEEMEQRTGNWASALLRRRFPEVSSPRTQKLVHEIAERILEAGGREDRSLAVSILAAPHVNAFVLPNGELFVFSGLLDALENTDQLAVVIAHEIDHMINHDMTHRLLEMEKKRISIVAIQGVLLLAGGVAEVLAPGLSGLGNSLYAGTTFPLGAWAQATIHGLSKEVELRADSNGAALMYAAGFDPHEQLSIFSALEKLRNRATERKELISSGFISAQPGLERRLEHSRETLKRFEP